MGSCAFWLYRDLPNFWNLTRSSASVGVSTSEFVRNEGEVIRHNFGWTLVLLVYLVLIGVACYLFFPGIAVLPKA